MTYKKIDGKFHIQISSDGIEIAKSSNGEVIPEDEPLMLFRARDYLALPLLRAYRIMCINDGCTYYHMGLLDERIKAFKDFQTSNPDKMKQPGVTRGL